MSQLSPARTTHKLHVNYARTDAHKCTAYACAHIAISYDYRCTQLHISAHTQHIQNPMVQHYAFGAHKTRSALQIIHPLRPKAAKPPPPPHKSPDRSTHNANQCIALRKWSFWFVMRVWVRSCDLHFYHLFIFRNHPTIWDYSIEVHRYTVIMAPSQLCAICSAKLIMQIMCGVGGGI